MGYIGEYYLKLDTKGRVTVPSSLKRQILNQGIDGFVLNKSFEACIGMYPLHDWERITDKINNTNLFVKKNRLFARAFQNGSMKVEMDSAGRLNIPNNLIQYSGIEKDIVIYAYADRIEIWDKAKFDQISNSDINLEDLAEDAMNDLDL